MVITVNDYKQIRQRYLAGKSQRHIAQVKFELIPISNLVSNQEYQRSVYMNHVARAAANFDLYQINPVKMSRRSGVNYVFNGQHTIEIVALVSGSRETPVWCMVYEDLVYEHEANIFANQMKYVKSLTPYEVFSANIEAGNDKQLTIRDLVESCRLTISPQSVPGGICAVSTLESIYDKQGIDVLSHVLSLLATTWEGTSESFSSSMLNGVAKVLAAYGDDIKDDVFIEKLSRVSLKEIQRSARERHTGAMGYDETLVNYYNKKNRIPLRWDKLYSHKNGSKKEAPSNGSADFAGYPNTESNNEPFPPFASTEDEAARE